jgi:hypothetical protein
MALPFTEFLSMIVTAFVMCHGAFETAEEDTNTLACLDVAT